jgi:hypothetical protein
LGSRLAPLLSRLGPVCKVETWTTLDDLCRTLINGSNGQLQLQSVDAFSDSGSSTDFVWATPARYFLLVVAKKETKEEQHIPGRG